MTEWREVTALAEAFGAGMVEREISLHAELLRVQVIPYQASDERALLVASLNAIALETVQLFVVEQHADFRFSWFPQLAFRRK